MIFKVDKLLRASTVIGVQNKSDLTERFFKFCGREARREIVNPTFKEFIGKLLYRRKGVGVFFCGRTRGAG